nr:CAP domain-containing protein [Sedimentibacter sp.]
MKNKIIAIALTLIISLSSSTVFAAENFNNYFSNLYNNNQSVDLSLLNNSNTSTSNTSQSNSQAKKTTTNNSASTSSNMSYERQVVQLVNAERQKAGLPSLTLDSSISSVARKKSQDMASNNYFAHQSPTYGSAGDMLKQFGVNYSAWGENIASGQRSPEAVVSAWMHSEGHKANILSSNFTKIGVGYAVNSNGTPYWTQMFTK